MRRLLTAGIFGTILGIVGAYSTANASIVSSGFLDEKLTEYALSTSLDLKANQSDLTALSNKIGIDRWNTGNINLEYNAFPFTVELFPEFRRSSEGWAGEGSDEHSITYYMVANNTDINVPGLAGVTNKLLNGWTNEHGSTINPGLKGMFDGWTAGGTNYPGLYYLSKNDELLQSAYFSDNLASLFINGANATTIRGVDYTGPVYPLWKLSEGIDKIGDLPRTIFPSMWTNIPYYTETGDNMPGHGFPLPPTLGEQLEFLFSDGNSPIERMFRVMTVAGKDLPVGTIESVSGNPQAEFLGLNPLTQKVRSIDAKIGTLPTGTPLVLTDSMENVNERSTFKYKINYPKSLSDLIVDLYGATDPSNPGLLSLFTSAIADMVWPHEEALFGSSSNNIKGLLERMDNAETKIAKIGTLPSVIQPTFWTDIPYYTEFGENMPDIPLAPTIGEQLELLFNGGLNSPIDRMFRVMIGAGDTFPVGTMDPGSGNPQAEFLGLISLTQKVRSIDAKIGTVPDGQTVAGMATTANTNANTAIEKIGTLPTEYETVGAALSAIKGIAEEAKTAALAAIPDPKQEGSSGKFVLTVDIIGDNATYRWEKIDRESEPTTTE